MYADIFKKRLSMHSRERFEGRNLFDFYKKSNKFRAHYKVIVEQSCALRYIGGFVWRWDSMWSGGVSILLFLVQDGF